MTKEFEYACELIEDAEGFNSTVYRCTADKLTQGLGRNLEVHPLTSSEKAELVNGEVSIEIARRWMKEELTPLENKLDDTKAYLMCNEVRRAVLLDMAFNMGIAGLGHFKKMWDYILDSNWVDASREMKDSAWYTQVGRRGKRNVELFARGTK